MNSPTRNSPIIEILSHHYIEIEMRVIPANQETYAPTCKFYK